MFSSFPRKQEPSPLFEDAGFPRSRERRALNHVGAPQYYFQQLQVQKPFFLFLILLGLVSEAPLEKLVAAIAASNRDIKRADDRIRLFQLPLERIV